MKNHKLGFLLMIILVALGSLLNVQGKNEYTYGIANKPWEESLGNHRAILDVRASAEVVSLDFKWRRPDKDVDKRCFLVVNSLTGDTVRNIKRTSVSAEECKLLFGPVEKGTYYFYYLPYRVKLGYGSYSGGYFPQEESPSADWLLKAETLKKCPAAVIEKVEARAGFDSFYPMEITATKEELKYYLSTNKSDLYLFPEDRLNPVRMREHMPAKWLDRKQTARFDGQASPNEYYTFQVALWAPVEDVNNISYKVSSLKCGSETISSEAVTCFNLEGVDPYGNAFKKNIKVKKGYVQPLWFGVDIPENQKSGIYRGTLTIKDVSGKQGKVPVSLHISGKPLADRGDSELWRYSRLRWLNSTLGIADTPVPPYTAMVVAGNQVNCLGRKVTVSETTGLPEQINSWGNDVLFNPIKFVIQTVDGEKILNAKPVLTEQAEGHISGSWKAEDEDVLVKCDRLMEFDGWMNYVYSVMPKKQLEIKDIRLEFPVKSEIGSYFLGAGLLGQDTPQQYDGKWDSPEKTVTAAGVSLATSKEQPWLWPFDSFWIGNAHAGIHCEFRGSTYSGPLLNLYRPKYPESWYNDGKGGFTVRKDGTEVKVIAYSGERKLQVGESVTFDFAILVTPVKQLNSKSQFTDRYYHNGSKPCPDDEDISAGVRVINVHQGNEYNPFINYPFLTADVLKEFTQKYHQKNCKVKIYYTLRELSNATAELWAIRSLDDEILRGGRGGGFPWCQEHLVSDYIPQWYEHFDYANKFGITADASLLTAEGDSRWYNYYIEGLAWMVRNMDIDGLYLDDVSFDRRILKRMRRAMDSVKPGCLIDLHSNTGFSKGPANQYAEFLPYIDKVWFGESFLYDKMTPANWLVESSGIPFGLMGDMLFKGGNAWLGMQYGMTVRFPWYTEGVNCDPRQMWKVWDDFGIADASMMGFWEKNPAVTATDDAVKVTAYRKEGAVLLSIGNYSDEVKKIRLNMDLKQLGLTSGELKLVAPDVSGFQKAKEWKASDEIEVQPRKGWLIYVQ